MFTISLVHATWHREGGPMPVLDEWLALAESPQRVDYVVGLDSDDKLALEQTNAFPRRVGPPESRSTAIRNWNGAAELAEGDLLFVIADDYFPPKAWDLTLDRFLQGFNPTVQPFVLKVRDSRKHNPLWVAHPVISRAYFEKFGLFTPDYPHMYCDWDFSIRAARTVPILDGRSILFDHRHPGEADHPGSRSQARGHSERPAGRAKFEEDHSLIWRILGAGLTPPAFFGWVSRFPSLAPLIQLLTSFEGSPHRIQRELRRIWRTDAFRRPGRIIKRAVRFLRGVSS